MILFCIRKEGDLDNLTPVIYNLSKQNTNKILIISTDPSLDFKHNFRIKFLTEYSSNISYLYLTDIFIIKFFHKLLYFIFLKKNFIQILKYFFKVNIKSLIDDIFYSVKMKKEYYKIKVVIIDHVAQEKILFLNKILNHKKIIKFNILSFPHGIPLLRDHNSQ